MRLLLLFSLLIGISACNGSSEKQRKVYTRDDLIEANKSRLNHEKDMIERYKKVYELEMDETSTGLQYDIYFENQGIQPSKGKTVTVTYKLFLLDSTLIADTEISGPLSFRVDEDDVVSGLHEGVKLLHIGDSALFILPSHLAYGLTGSEKVPSNASIVYDICLVDIN